jgi:phage-related baseplate assembly protein
VTTHIETLFTVDTAANILKAGLEIAQALGIPTSTWRVGDPTRACFKFVAETLGLREPVAALFVKSGFLSTAEGDWLTLLARELYGVERVEAVAATSTVTLVNSGGGYYARAAGEVTVSSSTSGQTYHSTAALALAPGATATLTVEADLAGSDGSAIENEIDTIVTTMLGVAITASTVAVGQDAQEDASLREQCRATLGALSPNGPPDAYEFVARSSKLTGLTTITRADATEDSATGDVTVYIAGTAGGALPAEVTAVQAAIDVWATPMTVTATVVAASEQSVDVTATVSGTDVPATIEDDAAAVLAKLLSEVPIGGLLSRSAVISTIHGLLVEAGVVNPTVTLSVPAADVELGEGEIPVLGTVTVTEV